jgi:putative nucleotidyltransferase with HDIG domain
VVPGPTQNYHDPGIVLRPPHPLAAAVVRAALVVGPALIALAVGVAAAVWLSPERLGIPWWLWVAVQALGTAGMLLVLARLARRLMPLSTMLRLTLYVPDNAPSRLSVALRRHSPEALQRRLAAADEAVGDPAGVHAELLLELVAALHAHDEGTRTHSERVQAYSLLVARELGLTAQDAAALSWAALLHDIGKLEVPREILTKPDQPTPDEWRVLTRHPETGAGIVAALGEDFGTWREVVGQHHERWDGLGYPARLAGEEISLGARIVAVADAYDAITSARSYKKPLGAAAARAELARCAGTQFDPDVVRAFLAISLGGLRVVAGPLSLLSSVPGLPPMPRIATLAATALPPATQVAAVVAGLALLAPWAPTTPAPTPLADPAVTERSWPAAPHVLTRIGTGAGAREGATSGDATSGDASDPAGLTGADPADPSAATGDAAGAGTTDPAGDPEPGTPPTGATGTSTDTPPTSPATRTTPTPTQPTWSGVPKEGAPGSQSGGNDRAVGAPGAE